MEHILQFGISIDDDQIRKRILDNAEKTIINEMTRDIRKVFFDVDNSYYGHPGKVIGLSGDMEKRVDTFIEENKNKIIELAAEKLADRLSRTKAAKDALATVLDKEK